MGDPFIDVAHYCPKQDLEKRERISVFGENEGEN
jgi:hypothetical protein